MTSRWPVHPLPEPGEALSSWIDRLASCYGLQRRELIAHVLQLGGEGLKEVDIAPPDSLLDGLAARTGVPKHQLRKMTAAGLPLWKVPAAGAPLVRSILLPPAVPTGEIYIPIRPWIGEKRMRRFCPECASEGRDTTPLLWGIPVVLTCDKHDCYLELWEHRHALARTNASQKGRLASKAAFSQDARTRSATEYGSVQLATTSIDATTWFELLHCILLELSTPALLTQVPARSRSRLALEAVDRLTPITKWQQFELISKAQQLRMLEASARCLAAIEEGALRPPGASTLLHALIPATSEMSNPTIFLTHFDECHAAQSHLGTPGRLDLTKTDDYVECMPERIRNHYQIGEDGGPWTRPRLVCADNDWGTFASPGHAEVSVFNEAPIGLEENVEMRED